MRNKYLQLGAATGWLGYIKTDEAAPPGIPSARVAEFQGGTMWVPPAWPVGYALYNGPVRDKYLQLGAMNSGLGYPDRDELVDTTTGRREGHFQGGTIVYQPGVGTTVTYTPPPEVPDPDPDPCETKPWMCDPE